jgi:hypothetical protein
MTISVPYYAYTLHARLTEGDRNMPELQTTNGQLQVNLNPLEMLVGFRRQLKVSLNQVEQISKREDPLSKLFTGIRHLGTHFPRLIRAGTYFHEGERIYWHVRYGQEAVELSLHHADYDRLIIGVDNADETINRLEEQIQPATC